MATLEELVLQLTAETSQLRAELNNATKVTQSASDKMEKAIKDFTDNSGKNLNFFQTAMATMSGFLGSQVVLGGFELLKDAAKAAFDTLMEGVDAAAAEEQALTRLANSLVLSGNYSVEAQKSLEQFASEMENLTGINDDVVASNLAVLSSITKLDAEGLKKAQQSAIDLSSAIGIDLEAATRLVAKGIAGNTEAFSKYGIEVQKGSNETQNFANVMTALSGLQGSAAGAMKTYAGAVLGAQNAFGNFVEEIAKNITQNPVVIAMIGELAKIFNDLTETTKGSGTAIKEGIGAALIETVKIIMIAIETTDLFIRTMETGFRALLQPINMVADSINHVLDLLDGTQDNNDPFKSSRENFEGMVQAVEGESALSNLNQKLAQIAVAGENAFSGIKDSAEATKPTIAGVTTEVQKLTEAEKAHQQLVQDFATKLAENSSQIDSQYQFQQEILKLNLEAGFTAHADYYAALQELQMQQFETEQAALEEARANNLITETQYQMAKAELAKQQGLEAIKLENEKKKTEETLNKQRVADLKSTFGTIATLQSSSSRELQEIGKAAAIAQATMDGYAAVQKALSAAPPPFNFALAALVGAATAANVAKIAGVGLQSGLTEVPRNASGGNLGDNFPAVLKPGERVVDSETNQDLKEFLANRGSGATVQINVTVMPGTGISREGAAQIVEGLNDYLASGGLKLLGTT